MLYKKKKQFSHPLTHRNGMKKNKLFFCVLTAFLLTLSLPLQAWDLCGLLDISAEARVAYYHPSSKKVRRIYGDGWADYQLEVSKGFSGFGFLSGASWLTGIDCRVWVGVNGFSRRGDSIGFHDRTTLQLIPVNFGVKIAYPIFCNAKIFVGGAACYSFLHIRDHSEFVHKHTNRQEWGGLVQSGINYTVYDWIIVSAFFDYFFQRFHFHNTHRSSFYGSSLFHDSRFIERHDLDLNGYRVGVGLGVTF
jgi:hypothetical protein